MKNLMFASSCHRNAVLYTLISKSAQPSTQLGAARGTINGASQRANGLRGSQSILCTFQQFFDEDTTADSEEDAIGKLDRAVQAVRDAEVLNSTSEAACSE